MYPSTETQTAKLATTLFALTTVSVAAWAVRYYVVQQNLGSTWQEIANAVFGVSTAGLLGGVVYEMFLRKEILAEVSTTLGEIVTTDRKVAEDIFSHAQRNNIIRTMLQLNTGNDEFGAALYNDLLSDFTNEQSKSYQPIRTRFRDKVTFLTIPGDTDPPTRYYEVVDQVSFRGVLRYDEVIVGCANSKKQLDQLFREPRCLYRWLLKAQPKELDQLRECEINLSADVSVDGVPWEKVEGKGGLGERGLEMHFRKPGHQGERTNHVEQDKARASDVQITVHALHPREMRFFEVLLAYPVKGVDVIFDFQDTDIDKVEWFDILTGGSRRASSIDERVPPLWAELPKAGVKHITTDEERWLFPDSGIIFTW